MINSSRFFYLFLLLVVGGLSVSAQNYKNREFCSNNWSNGNGISVHDLREVSVPASSLVNVDGRQNGGVSVIGENRSDVLVRSCVQAWGNSESEAQARLKSVRVQTGSVIHAEGDDSKWSVSYEIHVPRATNLNLTTHNGGISVDGVEGSINFEAVNGGVHLDEVAGSVKGRTQNGGLHIELAGTSWKGKGLDVETTNGGVNLVVPANYAAHFETQTTNGGFSSNLNGLEAERRNNNDDRYYRSPGVKISKDINGGGPLVRVVTTNGGVRIGTK